MTGLLRSLCWLLAAGLAAAAVLAELGGLWWPADLFSHFRYYYLAAALAAVVIMALAGLFARRLHWLTIPLVILTAAPHLWPLFAYPGLLSARDGAIGQPIRVVTANLLYTNPRLPEMAAWLKRQQADIVCLQEVVASRDPMLKALGDLYPHHGPGETRSDTLLLSRWPILQQKMAFPDQVSGTSSQTSWRRGRGGSYPYHVAVVKTPAGPLTVLCLHPFPPIGAIAAAGHQLQLRVAAIEARQARAAGRPVLVLGDLNITPWSPRFRRLLADGRLGAVTPPGIWPRSWPAGGVFGVLPGLPIDHVLASRRFRVRTVRMGPAIGADHHPVIVDLLLTPAR